MSLYKDASLVMIPSAYKDGKLYSIRPIPELGSELNPNVDFSSDTDWTHARGNWAISGGTLNTSSESDYCFVDIGDQSSKTLRIEYDIVSHSSGNVQLRLFGATTKYGTARDAVGTYVEYIDVPAGHNGSIGFQGFSSFTGALDNVSFKVVSNNGDFTFSRGSNLAATRVDVNGLIEKGRENTTTYSQDSSQWSDVKLGIVGSSNTDPFNGSSAVEYEVTSITGAAYFYRTTSPSISSGQVVTGSVYIKNVDQRYIQLLLGSAAFGNGHYQNFDLQTGTKGTSANIIDSSIESVGNGWYRLSITKQATASGSSGLVCGFVPSSSATRLEAPSTLGLSLQAFGFQTELGLVATDYIETGASTAQAGILEDMPRLDYSGGASCPSLLLEPQRTNGFAQSEYFKGIMTTDVDVTIDDNAALSPDGFQNAARLNFNTANRSMYRAVNFAGQHTFSFYVKAEGSNIGKTFDFRIRNTSSVAVNYDVPLTGEWVRHDFQYSDTNLIEFTNRSSTTIGTGGFLLWGIQIEAGSYPTSYIPTYGASVTRSVDDTATLDLSSAGVDGEDVTYFLEFKNNQDIARDSGATSLRFSSNTSNLGSFRIYRSSSSAIQLTIVFQDNGSNFAPNGYEMTSNNPKVAIKRIWATGQIQAFVDGTKVIDGTNTDMNAWYKIDMEGSGSTLQIKQLVAFPTALTDAECIALTTL